MRSVRNCPVAVVGGAGFLGSHLVNHLVEDRGCKVLVVDNLVAGRREFVHKDATFFHCDITGPESILRSVFKDEKIQFVLNYASWPYVPDSFARPLQVFNVNAMGALKVINAAQEAGVEAILQVSSAEIYGEGEPYPGNVNEEGHNVSSLTEESPVVPHSSYGAAKAAIDAMVQVRWREAKTPVIALRQFNCVGERETHKYVVPEIISQLYGRTPHVGHRADLECNEFLCLPEKNPHHYANHQTIRLGNNSTRDFMYAGDAVRIAVELLERGQFGETYNLGSETGVKIYDLAQMLSNIVGCGRVLIEEDEKRKRPWEIWHLCSDNAKIHRALGDWKNSAWYPLTTLEEALRRTVAWYEANNQEWVWE